MPAPAQPTSATPTAPTAGAPSPQGSVGEPAALPRWSALHAVPRAGVTLTGGPRAVVLSGTTYVFARGTDRNVWYVTWHPATDRYGPWQRLSGIHVADDPAVVSARHGTIDLFALGTDKLLYRRTLGAAGWGQWFQVDERTQFDAAAGRRLLRAGPDRPGRPHRRRPGHRLAGRRPVERVGRGAHAGPDRRRPRAAVPPPRHPDAFVVRASDGAVLHLPFANGAWRPTEVIAQLAATGRPAPAAVGNHLYLVAPAGSRGLEQAASAGADWSQEVLPAAPSSPAALLSSGGTLQLWLRTPAGILARATAPVPS